MVIIGSGAPGKLTLLEDKEAVETTCYVYLRDADALGKRIVDIRQAIVLAYVEADILIAIMIGLVYLVLPFQSEDIANHRLVILLRGCNRSFTAKVINRGVLPLLADNLAQIVRLNTAFCILLVLSDMVDGILLGGVESQSFIVYRRFQTGCIMPGRQCGSFQSVAVGSKGFQRVAKILAGSIVCRIIHQLFFLAYLHQIEFTTNVGRTPNQQIGLDGRQQLVSGTILQSDIHCDIIGKGLVLERLDRLVMLDDFGFFHIFCLDVLL